MYSLAHLAPSAVFTGNCGALSRCRLAEVRCAARDLTPIRVLKWLWWIEISGDRWQIPVKIHRLLVMLMLKVLLMLLVVHGGHFRAVGSWYWLPRRSLNIY